MGLRKICLALLLLGTAIGARAEILSGRVVDAETKEELAFASVSMFSGNSTTVVQTDSLGRFALPYQESGFGTLRVSLIGYHETSRQISTSGSHNRKDTLNLGTIELKPSDILLNTATVKGRQKCFTMRGDTIVFNPAAFNLEKNAYLKDLIVQLPGITVEDDKLFWNGKPVRIMMNGENIFGDDNAIISNLPVEAVSNIKAYNKASKMKEKSGRDDGAEDHVLDVSVKPGFLDRWYGDADLGLQSNLRYAAEMFLSRLSKKDPVMFFFNANDMNYKMERGAFWASGSIIDIRGKQQFGMLAQEQRWNKKVNGTTLHRGESVTASVHHTDGYGKNFESRESYLSEDERPITLKEERHYNHKLSASGLARFQWESNENNSFTLVAKGSFSHKNAEASERSALFDADPFAQTSHPIDDAFAFMPEADLLRILTTRSRYTTLKATDDAEASVSTRWEHFFNNTTSLELSGNLQATGREADGNTRRVTDYMREDRSETLVQRSEQSYNSWNADASVGLQHWLGKKVMLKTAYTLKHNYTYDCTDLYASDSDYLPAGDSLDTYRDAANSYRRRLNETLHTLNVSSTVSMGKWKIFPAVEAVLTDEKLEYRRGGNDNETTRNKTYLRPTMKVTRSIGNNMGAEASYSYETTQPDLLQTMEWTDDTNPLYITEGNPHLQTAHAHKVSFSGYASIPSKQIYFNLGGSYNKDVNPIREVLSYEPSTGVYRSHMENIRGGHRWRGNVSYNQKLENGLLFSGMGSVWMRQFYNYLTATAPQTVGDFNRTRALSLTFDPKVSYNHANVWTVACFANFAFDYYKYSALPARNYNTEYYRYGVEGRVNVGAFTFKTDVAEVRNAGNTISEMNRPILCWNASAEWNCLGNKGTLSLEFRDILHQDRSFFGGLREYGRLETRSNREENYIKLSFKYRFKKEKS